LRRSSHLRFTSPNGPLILAAWSGDVLSVSSWACL
jgi:hypothetical protein